MNKLFKIRELEHLKLLSDPLKLRILQSLAEGEGTARQLADQLGESVTKLYRHVDALLDAGLIEVVQETPKRGTVERSFRAVAQRFEVDQSLLAGAGNESGLEPVRAMLRDSETEILAALGKRDSESEDDMTLAKLRIKASPQRLAELRGVLNKWLENLQQDDDAMSDDSEEAGVLIAFYPIDTNN